MSLSVAFVVKVIVFLGLLILYGISVINSLRNVPPRDRRYVMILAIGSGIVLLQVYNRFFPFFDIDVDVNFWIR